MTKYITQVKNPADANDPYIIKDPNASDTHVNYGPLQGQYMWLMGSQTGPQSGGAVEAYGVDTVYVDNSTNQSILKAPYFEGDGSRLTNISFTDEKVKQTINSDAGGGAYPLLLTGTSSPTSGNADEATYVSDIRYESDFHGIQIGNYNLSQPAANTSTSLLTSSAYIQATSDANADQTMTVIGDFLGTGESSIMITGGTATTSITRDSIDTNTVSTTNINTTNATVSSLAGTGNRMVVANADGTLSTAAIPTNTDIYQKIYSANKKGHEKEWYSFLISGIKFSGDWDAPLVNGYESPYTGLVTDTRGLDRNVHAVWVHIDPNDGTTPVILSSPNLALTNIQSGTPITGGYLALDSNNNVIKTVAGGGDTVTGKTVTLSTTAQAAIQVNGTDSGSIKLPTNPPSTWLGTTSSKAAAGNHTHTLSVSTQSGNLTVTNNQYYKRTISANTTINVSPSSTMGSLCYLLIYNSSSSADYTVTFNAATGTLLGNGAYKILRGTRMEFSFVTTTTSETVMTYTTLR